MITPWNPGFSVIGARQRHMEVLRSRVGVYRSGSPRDWIVSWIVQYKGVFDLRYGVQLVQPPEQSTPPLYAAPCLRCAILFLRLSKSAIVRQRRLAYS